MSHFPLLSDPLTKVTPLTQQILEIIKELEKYVEIFPVNPAVLHTLLQAKCCAVA